MYHTTGFHKDDIIELCAMIHTAEQSSKKAVAVPPILGLFSAVVVTLTYLRRHHVQQELAESHGVSQSTISRAISVLTPAIARVTDDWVPTADDLSSAGCYIVDGTLLPCWSWSDTPELYSGKHKTTGLNVQVACDLSGRLAWISDPVPGRRHDSAALELSGVLETLDPQNWIGDKGYIGKNMITPIRKPPRGDLTDKQRKFNTSVHQIRWRIEQVIAHLKTWRILHVDYRRPLSTFEKTIAAVIGLHFFRMAAE